MSKSKNNGVDPQELINRYGADTARLFVMFAAPPEQTLEWNESAVEGAHRFIKRIWAFAFKNETVLTGAPAEVPGELSAEAKALRREVHLVLRQVSHDFERMQYNTVVSGGMKMLNALEGYQARRQRRLRRGAARGLSVLLRALYPACPHITLEALGRPGLRRRAGRPARYRLAGGGRGRAGAGRDRAGAAGQRQDARRHQGAGRRRQGHDRGHRRRQP